MILAILPQDQTWHAAKITAFHQQTRLYDIIFTEYGYPLTNLPEADLRVDVDYLTDDCEDASSCKICQRNLPLTFHHLVPLETHSHVMKKKNLLVPQLEDLYRALAATKPSTFTRTHWLQTHGIMICRKCHNSVHRAEPNIKLALEFNTLEALLSHPDIVKWKSWARKQSFVSVI